MSDMEHPMAEHARSFVHREETGRLPDDVYYPDAEDVADPDSHEVAALVREQYAQNNAERHAAALRDENSALRNLLTVNGIEVPEGL